MPRRLGALTAAALVATGWLAPAAHALNVVTYNLLAYPSFNLAGRQPSFRTVMEALPADVVIVQELSSAAGADSFLINVLRVVQPARVWKNGGFITATESAVFYDSLTTIVSNVTSIGTAGPRDVLVCLVRPRGYVSSAAAFRLYSVHFKAGNPVFTPADSTTRRAECTDLRLALNLAPAGTNLLLAGDTNFYGDWEGGYIRLTESQLDNDGRLKDAYPLAGTWNNSGYAIHHSQSPCNAGCPDATYAGGGLDDRFDFFLSSYSLQDGEGLDLSGLNTHPFGNDGFHYNLDIDAGGNASVPPAVATALRVAADHLPVYWVMQIPARIAATSALDLGTVIVGAPAPAADVSVANTAPAPSDELTYSLVAPVGFTAPGGPFAHVSGTPNTHSITMLTGSVGLKSGTLTISNDDPDSTSKPVLLSGRVLTHAEPSLDSLSATLSGVLDFGEHVAGDFADAAVRLHDFGFDALQARLQVSGAGIVGGDGRFSVAGGFTPLLVGAIGATVPIHFDDTGATLDSLYEATQTFTTADESLPGATAQAPLVVHLRAYVISAATGVDPGSRAALAFATPRPNPAAQRVRFAFELPDERPASLTIHDLGGRRVTSLLDGAPGAGRHQLEWALTDESGARVPAGLYFVRFRTRGLARTERVIVLP